MLCFALFQCISNLFVYCFFGKLATESYLDMSDYLYDCNWLGLSVDLQKSLIVMIGNMNQPHFYHGFGIATLDLVTFSNVSLSIKNEQSPALTWSTDALNLQLMKAGFTYYMTLKTIAI